MDSGVGEVTRRGRSWLCAALQALLACAAAEAPEPVHFDAERAFADLADLVALGPRDPGSDGAEAARQLIRERLRQAGWRAESHRFSAQPPAGPAVPMENLIGIRRGARPETVVLITHYDTKRIPGVRFVGANDGASGTAVLLELARQLGGRSLEYTTWLVFTDGEEALGESITARDGLYGSRALAERMQREGTLADIGALILIDMVADADLNLQIDRGSSPELVALLRDSARELGLESVLDAEGVSLIDDHTPFARKGVEPVLALIDFQFGGRTSPGPYWHTAADGLDAVSAESLNSVGRLLVQTYDAMERARIPSPRAGVPPGAYNEPAPPPRLGGPAGAARGS